MTNGTRKSNMGALTAVALSILITMPVAAAERDVSGLLTSANINVSHLRVERAEGILLVRGETNTTRDQSRISETLRSARVGRFANLVKVVPIPDDNRILLAVERELSEAGALNGSRIAIRCDAGVITLLGTVANASQRDLAIQIAQRVDGVKSVRSALDT